MPQYRNIHTGKVEEWTPRNDLGVMEKEDGTRWAIYGVNETPRFLDCHEFIFIAPPDPAPAPNSGGESVSEEESDVG